MYREAAREVNGIRGGGGTWRQPTCTSCTEAVRGVPPSGGTLEYTEWTNSARDELRGQAARRRWVERADERIWS
jgi:hypothetical protein